MSNSDEFLEFARPLSQRVIQIGGIAVRPPKTLDAKFEKILADGKGKTVLISFGSTASSSGMPQHMRRAFLETIREMKEVTFIWKVDKDDMELSKGLSNLITVTWQPQPELLSG